MLRTIVILSLLLSFVACSEGEWSNRPKPDGSLIHLPYHPQAYPLKEPVGFVKMVIPADNPLTIAGVDLGRHLFYDPILSRDSTKACASCHLQARGFGDQLSVSEGIAGRQGKRNALALTNIGYHYQGFFWDGRAASLEEQALIPVEDSVELGNDWALVVQKLQSHPTYPAKFRKAFGLERVAEIDSTWVVKAIAQFERSLISSNTKFDDFLAGKASLSAAEERGRLIFFDESETLPTGECSHCHIPPLFTSLEFFNNGLDNTDGDLNDLGRAAISQNPFDRGKFKTPTLRNIALTAPYMHDARFSTLEEVIDQYNKGGHYSRNESPNIRPLNLTAEHRADLIAFLNTLTDSIYLHHPGFGNPFQ
ncbi:MAG: cytochrome c peroxidase [Saprospiraceae bacterium]